MNFRNIAPALVLCACSALAQAQNSRTLEDGENWDTNGLTVGYRITNFRKQEVKREEMDRYEITMYVLNQRECDMGVRFGSQEQANEYARRQGNNALAVFECINATGARLTSKSANITAEPHYYTHRYQERTPDGKTVNRSLDLLIGYFLGAGQKRETSMIVIVPPGQKPMMRATVNF